MEKVIMIEGVKRILFDPDAGGHAGKAFKELTENKAPVVIDRQLAKREMAEQELEHLKKSRIKSVVYSEMP